MKARLLLAVAVLAFSACTKEKSKETPIKGTTCDYAPYFTGATFSYNMVDGSTDTLRYTLLVKGDSMISGQPWRVLEDVDMGDKSLFRCGGGEYETMADFSDIPGAQADKFHTVYLRDNLPPGGSWTESVLVDIPILGKVNVTVTHTIIQKGAPKTTKQGQTFDDVIGVRTEASVPPVYPAQEIFTNFYAKGVGLIQLESPTDTTYITSYVFP
ncbi:hypothetical protein [Chitinophaga caseinilytica]|uniref:Uncharacterized protein n=1 Tax=Chitinophaga caseinilytica TaxID=2267521 RepID=A0ABZ2Z6F0_9BACT